MKGRNIEELAKIFFESGIYSKNRYLDNKCPLRVFQKRFPKDAYSREIDIFLNFQKEFHSGNGADLPWWGNRFFTEDKGIRTMILSQDSRSPNAGSVTFYMPLLKENKSNFELREVIDEYPNWDPFVSFKRTKSFFDKCQLNYDFVYVTDAQKIDEDWEKILEQEIEIVQPDVIIGLGTKGLEFLLNKRNLQITKLVDKKDTRENIHINVLHKLSKKPILITSLFPSNANGHYTDKREENVVNTYFKVIEELQMVNNKISKATQ